MPETRTYDPAEGDPIAQAIRKAMGEPVRPVPPGPKKSPEDAAAPQPVVAPSATLGTFSFRAKPKD